MDYHSITPPPFRDADSFGPLESDATVIGSQSSITPHSYPRGLTARELAHALRGEMLGHFLLQQFIGGGGMGVVFKALDTTLDRTVAVKVVASHRVDNEDLQRRFLVEAQSTARLDHPNIARVHYIGRDRGLPYIVFEFIEGMNLRDMVQQRGPLPVSNAVGYVYQIAHALDHAWQREVVHRDIKPSNILVTPEGQAKLVDMGLARLRQMDDEDDELTATGITLGTFDYISPEQARDPRSADARSDMYSLGCTLFYMLTGQAPFAQGTALQKLLQHQSERPPDVRSFRSDIPDSVVRLLRRMLAKSPGDRQQTPAELVGELAEIIAELGSQLPYASGALPWTPRSRGGVRWRRHAAWGTSLAGLILLGVLIDRVSRDDAVASPFPELQPAPVAAPLMGSSKSEPVMKRMAPNAAADDSPAELPTGPAPDFDDPLPLREDWGPGLSLWDSVTNWPAPVAGRRGGGTGALEPPVDVGMWSTPALLPAPTVELDIYDDAPAAESDSTPAD
jgi:serine/threonine-protein kinase